MNFFFFFFCHKIVWNQGHSVKTLGKAPFLLVYLNEESWHRGCIRCPAYNHMGSQPEGKADSVHSDQRNQKTPAPWWNHVDMPPLAYTSSKAENAPALAPMTWHNPHSTELLDLWNVCLPLQDLPRQWRLCPLRYPWMYYNREKTLALWEDLDHLD